MSKASKSPRAIPVSNDLKEEFEHWRFLDSWSGFLPWKDEKHFQLNVFSDASGSGWGGVLRFSSQPQQELYGHWDLAELDLPIIEKEALALLAVPTPLWFPTFFLGSIGGRFSSFPVQPHLSLVLEEIATSYFFQLTPSQAWNLGHFNGIYGFSSSENVPRIWKPASLCPDCSYANDFGFNFCQSCGFQPSPPSVSPSAANVVLDLPAIDRRISSLQSARAAKPYEKQKSSLHLELESFLSSLPTPKSSISASPKDVIRFLVWKDSKGKTKIHMPSCPNFGTRSKLKCGCPSRLASGTVDNTIGKLRSIFNSIGRSGDWSGLSPRNPAAHQSIKKYLASISEEQAQARVSPCQAVPLFFDKASDLGRVYTKEVLLLPEKQGLLFHHTFGKTLRGKDSNIFAIKTCLHDSIVCPVVNLTTYVKLADLMKINLRDGFLFRATDAKGRVSSSPFVGSTVANRLRLHLTTLNIFQGETMHSFRSGCSITLSLLGVSDDQVARHVGWKSIQTAQYYSQVSKVMELSLPASLFAQGSVKGKDNVSHAESVSAEFRTRNDLEGLALAFP
ncbi:hypothetical protein OS493_019364 [Desmophyllum pertusum]|uniref:ALOG domain-containing protein n=1 Tax=Desmophyllum pertusum TaxID=174260 RepID=A0A9X0A0I4_9CNID|nr:hypothetical protein OS493_019364 [Desmophyllum pertusum]